MNPSSIFGLTLIALFIIGAIIVGNFLVASIFGIEVSQLPPFFKFLTHVFGAAIFGLFIKKFFIR